MLIKRAPDIRSAEITDKQVYLSRRTFMRAVAGTASVVATSALAPAVVEAQRVAPRGRQLEGITPSPFSTTEPKNTWGHITTYNNFVELGPDKSSPSLNAGRLRPSPWSVAIEGECAKPGVMSLEDILKGETLEERVYRLRCVEAWSMVIPWVGFPLANLIKRCQPTSRATFVEFTTLNDPRQMPGLVSNVLQWPYLEGLRMDEAMHPLTILAVGLYGEVLPNQNGAPLRLVVPWKYGFKSIKSVVTIRFVTQQPFTVWQIAEPTEYGFYANVNPAVSHPRWSQATERRLPDFFMRKTLPLNGYAEQVASLYAGMDLRRYF
jgi:sulfoxide reductase catalytic subunit YedY